MAPRFQRTSGTPWATLYYVPPNPGALYGHEWELSRCRVLYTLRLGSYPKSEALETIVFPTPSPIMVNIGEHIDAIKLIWYRFVNNHQTSKLREKRDLQIKLGAHSLRGCQVARTRRSRPLCQRTILLRSYGLSNWRVSICAHYRANPC